MMKLRNITALAAALLLALTLCVPAFGETPSWGDLAMDVAVAQRAERGIADNQPLLTEDAFPAGSSVSDWTALAMARAGIADDYAGYLARLQAYVERQYAENGGLHAVKATEYHRIALTAAALGGRPRSFRCQAGRNGHRSGGGGHLQLARRGGLGRTGSQRLDLRPTDHGRGRSGSARRRPVQPSGYA